MTFQPKFTLRNVAFLVVVVFVATSEAYEVGEDDSQVNNETIDASSKQQLDLAFIMDCTGSMGSYIDTARRHIKEIVDEIVSSSNSDVRVALVEYRDHQPQDSTFVTKSYDFNSNIFMVKLWLNAAKASGGGDGPEAVGEALFKATKLSWRPKSTKVAVLVSDAPPHGLVPSQDRSFPNGSPTGHDPMQIVRDMSQMGITMYVIGCEPAIIPYRDFFMALDYLTGGQYVPLSKPELLVDVVTGGAKEELSIQKFEELVQAAVDKANSTGGKVDKDQISLDVYNQLVNSGAQSVHLKINNATIAGPSDEAKKIATATTMAEVRLYFHKATIPPVIYPTYFPGFGLRSTVVHHIYPTYYPGMPMPTYAPGFGGGMTGSGSSFGTGTMIGTGGTGGTMTGSSGTGSYLGTGAMTGSGGTGGTMTSTSGTGDKVSVDHSGISMSQVDRLVEKVIFGRK